MTRSSSTPTRRIQNRKFSAAQLARIIETEADDVGATGLAVEKIDRPRGIHLRAIAARMRLHAKKIAALGPRVKKPSIH